jgi:hypothetical protein
MLLAAAGEKAGLERLLHAADSNGDTPAHTAAICGQAAPLRGNVAYIWHF